MKTAIKLAVATGNDFFRSLVDYLLVELNADRAAVSKFLPGTPCRAVELAVSPAAELAEYPLAGTPEGLLVHAGPFLHCDNVSFDVAGDPRLAAMNAEHWSGVLLPGSTGEPHGFLSVAFRKKQRDVAAIEAALSRFAPRAAAEFDRERTQDLNAGLQRMVADRTSQLAAANQELESFSYSVSHDLRAAIQGILACSRIVVQDHGHQLDETGRVWLNHMADDAAQLDKLTMALLDLALVSRAGMCRSSVDLSGTAESILRRLQDSDRGRKANFHVAPGLAVSADPALLCGVMDNLLGNAWKFTGTRETAEIEVGVTTGQASEPVYFVRDNGVGFNMKYSEKLFGAFQRLHRIEDFKGNGIGLATVRRVIHRHGGRVWAEAGVDQGATFFFTLGTPDSP